MFFAGLLIISVPDTISKSEVERRARELGMVYSDEVFAFNEGEKGSGSNASESSTAGSKEASAPSKSEAAKKDKADSNTAPKKSASESREKDSGETVSITISPGSTLSEVGEQLYSEGVIDSQEEFLELFDRRGLSGSLMVGTYELNKNEDLDRLANILCGKEGSGN